VWPEGLCKLKKFIHLTGSLTRDLPACSIVPKPFKGKDKIVPLLNEAPHHEYLYCRGSRAPRVPNLSMGTFMQRRVIVRGYETTESLAPSTQLQQTGIWAAAAKWMLGYANRKSSSRPNSRTFRSNCHNTRGTRVLNTG
jgi:hypothetical protein